MIMIFMIFDELDYKVKNELSKKNLMKNITEKYI